MDQLNPVVTPTAVPTCVATEQEPQKEVRTAVVGFWSYVGFIVLFMIPVIGLIANIVFACGVSKRQNITNFSRAFLAVSLVLVIVFVIFAVIVVMKVLDMVQSAAEFIQDIKICLERFKNGEISKEELVGLADGGLCQMCKVCHWPNCTFGRY